MDLLGSWEIVSNVTAGVNLNNALNKKYYERSASHNWITPGEPRNLNFNLAIHF